MRTKSTAFYLKRAYVIVGFSLNRFGIGFAINRHSIDIDLAFVWLSVEWH